MAREREVVIESYRLTKVFRDFWRRPKVRAVQDVAFSMPVSYTHLRAHET